MKITPRHVIKDGGQIYEPDAEHDVPGEVGRRFVILGWATSPEYTLPGVEPAHAADVAPDSVRHATTVTEV